MYHSSAAGLLGLAGAERTLVVAPEGAIAVAVIRPRNGGTDFKYLLALWSSLMRRIAVLIASAAINVPTIPAVTAEYTSNKNIDASRACRETVFQIFTASPLPASGRPGRLGRVCLRCTTVARTADERSL